jgi:hypothetical protein
MVGIDFRSRDFCHSRRCIAVKSRLFLILMIHTWETRFHVGVNFPDVGDVLRNPVASVIVAHKCKSITNYELRIAICYLLSFNC